MYFPTAGCVKFTFDIFRLAAASGDFLAQGPQQLDGGVRQGCLFERPLNI